MNHTTRLLITHLILAGTVVCLAAHATAQQAGPGTALFFQYCASCHGPQGYGNGTVAASLRVQPADLTRISARRAGNFPRDEIIRIVSGEENPKGHGTRIMPVWGERLQEDLIGGAAKASIARGRISFLVDYLQTLQQTEPGTTREAILPLGEPPAGGREEMPHDPGPREPESLIYIPFGTQSSDP